MSGPATPRVRPAPDRRPGDHGGSSVTRGRAPRAFVALLRGVNVGTAKRLPMAGLRELLSGLGFTGVATLLNSGNAVFHAGRGTAAQHAAHIRTAIAHRFDFDVPVVVVPQADWAAIVAACPFETPAPEHSRLLVAFAQDGAALQELAAVAALAAPAERFAVGRHAAYLHCPGGILGSRAAEALLGRFGKTVTTRNWATVLKLQALLGAAGGEGPQPR